jgi:hypothetical protein
VDRSPRAPKGREADPLVAFLRYLFHIEEAVVARDALRITSLLRKRTAMHLPRTVREELLAISRMSRNGLRAPIQFLRFQHRMAQLALGREEMLTAQTELRLEPPAPTGTVRRDERRAAARTSCDDPEEEGPQ